MHRLAFTAFYAACALAIGIPATISLSASAEDQPYRPLSKIPRVERFGQVALDRQADFLRRMPGAEVRYGDNGAVSWVKGHTGVFLQSGLAGFQLNEPATELLEKVGPALLAVGTEELRVANIHGQAPMNKPESSERTVKLVQYIRGREVQQSAVNISLDIKSNEIMHLVADFLPDRGLPQEPDLTAAQARARVEASLRDSVLEEERKFAFEDKPAHLAYAFEDIGENGGIGGVLVWVFQASRDGEPVEVNVNALTGEVVRLRSFQTALYFPNRLSYSANYTAPPMSTFPSGYTFTFGEGGTPPDQVAGNLYDKAGIAFSVFDQVFQRNSWNNAGASLRLITHYVTNQWPAAYYPGGYITVAENSPGSANDIDTIVHEYTHGVVQAHSGSPIPNNGPPDGAPALNEAFADWGATVADVHLNLGAVTPATWQIANVRNLQFPTLGNIFARDWYPSRSQILGAQTAHRNSTIMGHAFYLLSMGGQHNRAGIPGSEVPVIPVTALTYPAARNIFYDALTNAALTVNATFGSMKNATLAAALPGQQASVQQAWNAVGVGYNCSAAPQAPVITTWPAYCKGRYDITWPGVAGATRYDGQVTQANLGWAFAHTAVDGNVTSCQQDLPNAYWMMRVRACNGCGCSSWSNIEYMQYYMPCL